MAKLIGISGQAGVGKTTAANIFVDVFKLVEVSFADPIKRAAKEWWGFSDQQLYGESKYRNIPDERYPMLVPSFDQGDAFEADRHGIEDPGQIEYLTTRSALQGIGDKIRQIDPEVWLRLGSTIAKRIVDQPTIYSYSKEKGLYSHFASETVNGVVFGDVRYIIEMKSVKEAGGLLIRIKRPNAGLTGSHSEHPSEKEQLSVPDSFFDVVIDNDKFLDDFNDSVISAALSLGLNVVVDDETQTQLEFQWK